MLVNGAPVPGTFWRGQDLQDPGPLELRLLAVEVIE
jgi:hypothetical protein